MVKNEDDIPKGYGERLRVLRTSRGLTVKEVADSINISKNQMGNYESEKQFPSGVALALLAKLYQTSIEFLVWGDLSDENARLAEKISHAHPEVKKVITHLLNAHLKMDENKLEPLRE